MHRIADPLVDGEGVPRGGKPDQVDLVGHHHRLNLVVLGHDQEAIDHAHVGDRVGAGEHDQHLVEVRDDHVLFPRSARTRLAAAEASATRLDRLDHCLPVGEHGDRDPVTDHDEVGVASFLLDATAQAALDERLVIGEDGVEATTGAQDGAGRQRGSLAARRGDDGEVQCGVSTWAGRRWAVERARRRVRTASGSVAGRSARSRCQSSVAPLPASLVWADGSQQPPPCQRAAQLARVEPVLLSHISMPPLASDFLRSGAVTTSWSYYQ